MKKESKILPIFLTVVFAVCILGFLFEVKFPIGCEPSRLKFIAMFFGKCDY